jgi:protein-L-isoaspartate(D-aspartate) O-methyltransferase
MGNDTAVAASPDDLRAKMASEVATYKKIVTDGILAAVGSVPRHLFLPGVSLERAYGLGTVVTHRDARGVALSSASGLGIVVAMLKQLDPRPGQRVLEIGAGTGYNAALLRHIVGPEGSVTTVDIFADAATEARDHLAAAGYGDVTVVRGDGELGVPDHAPHDRIIVTAGASDLPEAWAEQLTPGGVVVVPLRMNGLTRSVAFERGDGCWRSRDLLGCGFMPMRGDGQVGEHNLAIRGETGVVLRTDGGDPLDAVALKDVLEGPATVMWTGVTSPDGVFSDLDFWLANLAGFCRVIVMGKGVDAGLVPPQYTWGSMGAVDGATFAYLTTRKVSEGGAAREIGVCGYGPGSQDLPQRVISQIRMWDRDMNGTGDQLWVEVHPLDSPDLPPGHLRLRKRYNWVIVGRSADGVHPGADPTGAIAHAVTGARDTLSM